MNTIKNWTRNRDNEFSLDKYIKKVYNKSNPSKTTATTFDDDAFANSALDYLYSNGNRNKTQSFLKNNGFPSAGERQFNKELYGVQTEQKQMRDLLKSKTTGILNPNLPNDTDRAFLKGLMGEKEGERDYQKQITGANRALKDLQDAFRDSQFESILKPITPSSRAFDEKKYILSAASDTTNPDEHIALFDSGIKDEDYKYTGDMLTYGMNNSVDTLALGNTSSNPFKDIFNNAKQTLQSAGNYINEKQKEIQRNIWRIGAQKILRDEWGFETSAWMLEHSLQDNPSNEWRGNDSRVAGLIKKDPAFVDLLNTVMKSEMKKNKPSFSTPDEDPLSVTFEGKTDLFFSIHSCRMWFSGVKQKDGSWIVDVHVFDTYDYTKFLTLMGKEKEYGTGTLANDAAHVSQLLGAISPYTMTIDFQVRWPQ